MTAPAVAPELPVVPTKKKKRHGDTKRTHKAKVKSKAKKQEKKKKKKKVRASDQGVGGVVIGEGLKSQMMRIDPRLGEFIRKEAKRLTKETGKYHNATDASRSLHAFLKSKGVKLKPFHPPA